MPSLDSTHHRKISQRMDPMRRNEHEYDSLEGKFRVEFNNQVVDNYDSAASTKGTQDLLLRRAYTELYKLYRIFVTLPITVASCESTFSKLTFVKNSTMSQERLNFIGVLPPQSSSAMHSNNNSQKHCQEDKLSLGTLLQRLFLYNIQCAIRVFINCHSQVSTLYVCVTIKLNSKFKLKFSNLDQ